MHLRCPDRKAHPLLDIRLSLIEISPLTLKGLRRYFQNPCTRYALPIKVDLVWGFSRVKYGYSSVLRDKFLGEEDTDEDTDLTNVHFLTATD